MGEILTISAITAGAYIGTNLDNLVLLVALHSRYKQQTTAVTAGYVVGMMLIGALSFVIGKGGAFIPLSYLGMLGVIPIMIGVVALVQLFRNSDSEQLINTTKKSGLKAIFIAVLMTQLGNGSDSIITFSILLAESTDSTDYMIALTFLGMICVFAWLAFYSLKHRGMSNFLERYGHYATPFILILVGMYIISNTATDLMPG